MAKVTQYTVIQDGQVNLVLPAGQPSADFTFSLPGLPSAVERRDNAVLAWVVDTEVSGQQLGITFNGTNLGLTAKLPGTAYQTLHEVVEKNLLKAANNNVIFTVTGGNGVMRVSDVVLWWQFNV
jgi:hypothetical protein